MPVNGLVWAADTLQLRVEGSASGSHSGDGTGVYTWSGTGTVQYADSTTTIATGFLIQIGGSSATGNWSVTYTGPGSPLGTTWNGSGWTSANCLVQLTDVRLYNTGTAWRLVADYEVFAGGVSRLTGSIDESNSVFGPAFVPLLGMPINVSGSASASTTGLPTYTQSSTYDYQSQTSGTVIGGWRYLEVGGVSWQAPDVNVLTLSVPTVACDETKAVSAISATSTYTCSVPIQAFSRTKRTFIATNEGQINVIVGCAADEENPAYEICNETGPLDVGSGDPTQDVYSLENWTESQSGSLRAVPDCEKAFKRFNDDFKVLAYRTKFPQTVVRRAASCTDGMVVTSDTDDDEVHPLQDVILQVMEETTASMEDTLAYPSYAPLTASGGATYTKVYQYYDNFSGVLCPPSWLECDVSGCTTTVSYECDVIFTVYDDEDISYSASVVFPYSVGGTSDMAGYLGHTTSALARYINSWCNPHWSYGLWTESWEVDSSAETWDDYWEKIGSQWVANTAASITDETRNHLVSEPLGNDGNSGFLESNFAGLRWLGISRWITKEITPRSSYTFTSASSSLWAGTDCTITHGSDMTVNPSASPCEVALTIGSFTVEPYQWVHLADRITADWTATNITDCKVYLEAADGTRVLLNDNEPGTAKYRVQAQCDTYAGSWKQDFGAGVVTDEGSDDISPDGVSSAVMASPERAYAFEMLADFTAAKLVYLVEVADVDTDFNIDYPEFEYTKSNTRLLTPENAHQVNIVHSEGPGVRFGFWDTGTSGTVNNPPAVYDPSERPNTVDWLVAERLAVRGVAYNDGLTTELTSLRDTFEGQSVGNERTSSYGFWLVPEPASTDWYLALVSSLAECPPLGCFPRRERVKTDWSETGSEIVQHSWVWAQGPDYLVNPAYQTDLVYSASTWTAGTSATIGWRRSRHSHAVDNTETGAKVVQGSVDYATVRPWRGFYSVVPPGADLGAVDYVTHRDGMHYRSYINGDGKIVSERSDNLLVWAGETTTIDADYLSLSHAFEGYPGVYLNYTEGGVVYQRQSSDGVSWGVATTISTGASNTHSRTVHLPGGRSFTYWINSSGNIVGSEYDAAGNTVGATVFSTSITGVDNVAFGAAFSTYGQGRLRVVIQCTISGVLTEYVSTDGRSFS